MAHCRHSGSSASLCLLIDFHVGDLHQERHGGSALRLVSRHRSRSMVSPMLWCGMASAPRMPMCPMPGSTGVHPCTAVVGASLGYPSLLPTDSRRLEWQFLDPISPTKIKSARDQRVTAYGSSRGTSPKFEGLCLMRADPTNDHYRSKADETRFDVGRHIGPILVAMQSGPLASPSASSCLRKLEPAQKNKTLVCARLPNSARSYTGVSFESCSEALIVPVLEGIWAVVFERK